MNEIMIFNNPEFGEVRTLEEGGTVLFCGTDVARALGYAKPQNAVATHCPHALKRGIGVQTGTRADGTPAMQMMEMTFIPESDLYRLVFSSKLPTAEKFTDWVTEEVLPSIRKHGAYMTPATIEKLISDPDTIIQLATALKEEQEKRLALMGENIQLKSELDKSKEWYSIKRVARINGVSHRRFDWRKLKRESVAQGHGVRKIFDANYGEVNVYHMNVWERVYPDMEL